MRNIDATAGSSAAKRKSFWPWIVVGMLAVHTSLIIVAMMIATHDRSFLVVPGYYQRAVNWDAEQAKKRESAQLGWQVRIDAADAVDALGRRAVNFALTDAAGNGIPGATMEVEYFHHKHGDQSQDVTLTSDAGSPGRFSQLMSMRYAGTWEFHFTVTAKGRTFIARQMLELGNAQGTSNKPGRA